MMGFRLIHPDEDLLRIHSKPVSNYDINHKLAFPVPLLDHLWPQGPPYTGTTEFTSLDIYHRPWRFICKLRRTAIRGNPQPEVSGQTWKDFVQQKQMRVGDKLVFYLPPPPAAADDAPPVFVISVTREIIIHGTPIIGHIPL